MTGRSQPSKRRQLLMAAVVVVVLVAGGTVALVRRSATNHPKGPQLTAWQQVMRGASESGETTVTMARQAFSLTFEPLPGVRVPDGSRSDIQSGSAALRMMIAHWSELTTSEHQTVLTYLPGGTSAQAPAADTIPPPSAGASGLPVTRSAQFIGYHSGKPFPAVGPDDATQQMIGERVGALRELLGSVAGQGLTGTVELSYNDRDVEMGSAAYTLPHAVGQVVTHPTPDTASLSLDPAATDPNHSSIYSGCFIAFNRDGWESRGTDLDFVIAHELYHCFEGMFIGDLDIFYDKARAPAWVIEGGANWAAAQVVPTSQRASGAWQDYLLVPATPLFQQGYEAMGFWNHLTEISALTTWGALRRALGKTSAEALAETDGETDAFLDSWASSLFRQPQFGINWQTNGPTMSALRFTPESLAIANGDNVSRAAAAHAKTLLYADISADIIVIVGISHVTMHSAAHDDAQFGQLLYCARDQGCECPPGSINTSPPPAALGGHIIAFGVTGSQSAAAVALGGISLADWCQKANPPISKRPASSSGSTAPPSGSASGDLCHQITEREGIDGLLNYPSFSPQDIQDCVAEILAENGLLGG